MSILDRLLFGPESYGEKAASMQYGSTEGSTEGSGSFERAQEKDPFHLVRTVSCPSGDQTPALENGKPNAAYISSGYRRDYEEDLHARRPPHTASFLQRSSGIWRPRFMRPRAIAGIAALLTVVACLFASLAILVYSDGQAASTWPVQPTVYLAIVTAIANSAIVLAKMEGTSVS